MKARILLIVLCLFLESWLCGRCAEAQLVRDGGKMDRGPSALSGDFERTYAIYRTGDEKEYIAYSQVVRERLRSNLKGSFKKYYREGEVRLLFILNSDGSLYDFRITPDSTNDKKLRGITALSLKKASPFPTFPRTLPFEKLSFSVVISFCES